MLYEVITEMHAGVACIAALQAQSNGIAAPDQTLRRSQQPFAGCEGHVHFIRQRRELARRDAGVFVLLVNERAASGARGDIEQRPRDVSARITSYNVCYTKLLRICFS